MPRALPVAMFARLRVWSLSLRSLARLRSLVWPTALLACSLCLVLCAVGSEGVYRWVFFRCCALTQGRSAVRCSCEGARPLRGRSTAKPTGSPRARRRCAPPVPSHKLFLFREPKRHGECAIAVVLDEALRQPYRSLAVEQSHGLLRCAALLCDDVD